VGRQSDNGAVRGDAQTEGVTELGASPANVGREPLPEQGDPVTIRRPERTVARILLVGQARHDPTLESQLRSAGYDVSGVAAGEDALAFTADQGIDLAIVDVILPKLTGFETCRRLRAAGNASVIFLTDERSLAGRLHAFDLGADDYLVRPVAFPELDRRIRAVLRRAAGAPAEDIELTGPGGLVLRRDAHEVRVRNYPVPLTPYEFALLELLLEKRGHVLDTDTLSRGAWGHSNAGSRNYVEAHISRLRRKLAAAGLPGIIETVRGVGYGIPRDRRRRSRRGLHRSTPAA
jgi:DNA-binding response OmpR family regulator